MKKLCILLLVSISSLSQNIDSSRTNYFDRVGKPKTIYNQQASTTIFIPLTKTNDKFEIPLNEEKIKKFIYKKKLKWMNM